MTDKAIQIRRADVNDLSILAKFGFALAQLHASFDERRFVMPDEAEATFLRFFAAELERDNAVLLVAEMETGAVGYAFVRIESASIEELRAVGAYLHDIYVAPEVRTLGIGHRLLEAAFDVARSLGSTSLMLGVSPHNASGRALFGSMGFRPTMIEMRVELSE